MEVKEKHIYDIKFRKSKVFLGNNVEIEIEGTLFFEVTDLNALKNILNAINTKDLQHVVAIKIENILESLLETISDPHFLLNDPIPFLNLIRVEIRQQLAQLGLTYVEISPLKLYKEAAIITTSYD